MTAEFIEWLHGNRIEILERNRKRYWAMEQDLPDWLQARIKRFRDAGGEQFLLRGWWYELVICRLAAVLDTGDEAAARTLSDELGASMNQWDCALCLTDTYQLVGDVSDIPAGISPLTGSADYS